MRGRRWAWMAALGLLALAVGALAVAGAWWLGANRLAAKPQPGGVSRGLAATGAVATGRIAIVGEDDNIALVAGDGGAAVALTNDASNDRAYRYPTWAPDGQTLAFVEISLDSATTERGSAIHLASLDGGAARRIPTEFPPFYLFWSPTSEALAFLSNWSSSMALRLVDVAGGATDATTVEEGAPFYFSWQPNGQSLLAHIGSDDLTFLDRAGNRAPLDVEPGAFQAPHWSADGQRLAFVARGDGGESVLSVSNAAGGDAMEIARERALFTFSWSSDSEWLAYSYTSQQVGVPAFGPLWIREVTTGRARELSREPVIAFFWSPDGRYVAFLRPEARDPVERSPEAAPLSQRRQLWLRWHVWDGERTYPLALFSPTQSFLSDYLRYFDQYAQSISLWSPDSRSLLYAGLGENGVSGIWTLPVADGSLPTRVGRGVLATWSPR